MSAPEATRSILDDCESWAPMPGWAYGYPGMTPRARDMFGLLILWSDKATGLTYNVKRSTIAERLGLKSTNSIDDALKVLSLIGCVQVIKNPRQVFDADGKPTLDKNGKPAVWWGPSQYKVSLADPSACSHEKMTTPQEVATDSCLGSPRKNDQGSHEKIANNQEDSYKSISTHTSLSDTSQAKVSEEARRVRQVLNGRSLPRELPCDKLAFISLMQQMSRDCFRGEDASRITMTNYNDVKRYCKEIAHWLLDHGKKVDAAYLYAFAHYYRDLGNERFECPKPVSYSRQWDDEGFWDGYYDQYVDEYRKAVAQDAARPPMCRYEWNAA